MNPFANRFMYEGKDGGGAGENTPPATFTRDQVSEIAAEAVRQALKDERENAAKQQETTPAPANDPEVAKQLEKLGKLIGYKKRTGSDENDGMIEDLVGQLKEQVERVDKRTSGFESELAVERLQRTREQVRDAVGLSAEDMKFVPGDTPEEILANAKAFAERVKSTAPAAGRQTLRTSAPSGDGQADLTEAELRRLPGDEAMKAAEKALDSFYSAR